MMPAFEIILQVGAEGGSVALHRWETSPGNWTWAMETNEVALYDLLEGEDGFDSRHAVKHQYAHSFEDAIKLLDKYPWPKLYPMEVHPQFRDAILKAVLERDGSAAERRWQGMI